MASERTDWSERAKQARKSAQRFIDQHFRNKGERPCASIPANRRRDDDLMLCDYIEESSAEINKRRAALKQAAKALEAEHGPTYNAQKRIRDLETMRKNRAELTDE